MNFRGGTSPVSGSSQRIRASRPLKRPSVELDLGLVVKHELLLLQRAAHAVLQQQGLRHRGIHLWSVELVALALVLGGSERRFRVSQQPVASAPSAG